MMKPNLVGLVDSASPETLNIDHFDAPFFANMEDLLANVPDVDVINVCTPNGLHASQALIALNARKHVVCEKPMGLSKANCEEVIYKALQVNRHVLCVMQNRYSPPSVWLKQIIEE